MATQTNPQWDRGIRNNCPNPQWAVVENYGNTSVVSVEWMTEEENWAKENQYDFPNWGWRWFFETKEEADAFASERILQNS